MSDSRVLAATVAAAISLLVVTFALAPAPGGRLPGEAARPSAAPAGTPASDTLAGLLMLLQLEPAEPRPAAVDFTLPLLGGGSVRLAGLEGQVVLLNFWATWCGPCREEMPAMERVYRELAPRGFTIVAVDFREAPEVVRPFVEELGLTFPIALDRSGEVSEGLYRIVGLPTSYLIDRRGRAVARAVGLRDWESGAARALFELLLDEPAA